MRPLPCVDAPRPFPERQFLAMCPGCAQEKNLRVLVTPGRKGQSRRKFPNCPQPKQRRRPAATARRCSLVASLFAASAAPCSVSAGPPVPWLQMLNRLNHSAASPLAKGFSTETWWSTILCYHCSDPEIVIWLTVQQSYR